MLLHKIINKKIAIPLTILPKCARDGSKFQQTLGRVLAYSNSFVPTVTKYWNKLPKHIREITNEDQLKNKMIEYFMTK